MNRVRIVNRRLDSHLRKCFGDPIALGNLNDEQVPDVLIIFQHLRKNNLLDVGKKIRVQLCRRATLTVPCVSFLSLADSTTACME